MYVYLGSIRCVVVNNNPGFKIRPNCMLCKKIINQEETEHLHCTCAQCNSNIPYVSREKMTKLLIGTKKSASF